MDKLNKNEKDILKVIKNELNTNLYKGSLKETNATLEDSISSSESLLNSLGIEITSNIKTKITKKDYIRNTQIIPFENLLNEANNNIPENIDFTDIFTKTEMEENFNIIKQLNDNFNGIHKLDKIDWAICTLVGLIAAAIDIILVGIPSKGTSGTTAGSMSNWIRSKLDEVISKEDIVKLERLAKVPYDASMNVDNRGNSITDVYVDGLTPYFHRLVSVGHDPLLGLIFGVLDVLSGTMTTIDRKGKIIRQVMPIYSNRVETDIIEAIKKVVNHFRSDVNTSMGLPAPFMSVFNLFQFGDIGEMNQTIAEIVQGMYYDGYDFIHFLSSSIPVVIIELGVRISYAFKRIGEGYSIKESIPITSNRKKRPKLSTMLFTAHTIASAVNAGKVVVATNTGVANPFLAINYPQWLAFVKTSFQQLKWVLLEKPEMRHKYVMGLIQEEYEYLYDDIDDLWMNMKETFILKN